MENNSNKLGKMPVLKLMAVMSIPAMFSMLVQALYNIVDSVFVGMISDTDTEMLSLNIAFPLQMIFFAIALGIGIGTNSLISRKLGEGPFRSFKSCPNWFVLRRMCYTCCYCI